MKASNPKKSISNLENQKVDAEKIQGGGIGSRMSYKVAPPVSLTKDEAVSFESDGSSAGIDIPSTTPLANKRGSRTKKRMF